MAPEPFFPATAAENYCSGHHFRGARATDGAEPVLGLLQGIPGLKRSSVASVYRRMSLPVGAVVEGACLQARLLTRTPTTAAEGS